MNPDTEVNLNVGVNVDVDLKDLKDSDDTDADDYADYADDGDDDYEDPVKLPTTGIVSSASAVRRCETRVLSCSLALVACVFRNRCSGLFLQLRRVSSQFPSLPFLFSLQLATPIF